MPESLLIVVTKYHFKIYWLQSLETSNWGNQSTNIAMWTDASLSLVWIIPISIRALPYVRFYCGCISTKYSILYGLLLWICMCLKLGCVLYYALQSS